MKLLTALLMGLALAIGGSDFGPVYAESSDSKVHEAETGNAGDSKRPYLIEVFALNNISKSKAEDLYDLVDKTNKNKRVKAIVLIIDSPGGGVIATAAMYEAIAKFNAPVVAWCDYMCASGGLYMIMAPNIKYRGLRKETLTGSIGVVISVMQVNRLMAFLKLDPVTYKSGPLKDSGNPMRAATPEDHAYMQSLVTVYTDLFYEAVKKGRPKITPEAWAEIKSARVFIGQAAVDIGLFDGILSKQGAIAKAKELAGVRVIFTRDELEEIAELASEDRPYGFNSKAGGVETIIESGGTNDGIDLLGQLKDALQGRATVSIEYRLPFTVR